MSLGYALLSVQGALLSAVTPELRAVVVDFNITSEELFLRLYYNGNTSEKLIDLWQCAITEASAHLGPDCRTDGNVERLDYPQTIPLRGRYAYLRKEPILPDHSTVSRNSLQTKKEIINYHKVIGIFDSPLPTFQIQTQWAVACYTKNGCQMIPARPPTYPLMNILPLAYAMLAIQRALLGVVVKELIAVIIDVKDQWLYIRFYYEEDITHATHDDWELAITKTWADLGADYTLDANIEQLIYPHSIPFHGRFAYSRKEIDREGYWPVEEKKSI